ncbi:MAG: hypothetical protein ABSG59_23795 [Verrucomicrobiota bacterium]|jgi:hypothetical protein
MTAIEGEILDTLVELEKAAAETATARPKPDLRALFARLDTLAAQLPKGTDPDLVHYLHRKSYQKARVRLQQR